MIIGYDGLERGKVFNIKINEKDKGIIEIDMREPLKISVEYLMKQVDPSKHVEKMMSIEIGKAIRSIDVVEDTSLPPDSAAFVVRGKYNPKIVIATNIKKDEDATDRS